jgi:phosphoribosylformylglycinamidine (FGAM) synthase-like enzyme
MQTGAVISIQDMGAAGLTCSAVEMGDKGGLGHPARPRPVPAARDRHDRLRDDAVGKPGADAHGAAPRKGGRGPRGLRQMGSRFRHRGRNHRRGPVPDPAHGEVKADLPLSKPVLQAPEYDRPWEPTPPEPSPAGRCARDRPDRRAAALLDPQLRAKQWVYEQYDSEVMADTVRIPGPWARASSASTAPTRRWPSPRT